MLSKKASLFFITCLTFFSFNTSAQNQPADLVEPWVDSANSRFFFFSSATRPFGMVNLSPDMALDGAWNSGYRYNENTIKCFSHVHAWQMSGVPVLPTTGTFKGHLGPDVYGSRYSHETELAKAGYHKVVLDDYQITAELTATTRVGFHKYTYPQAEQSHILFDLTTVLGNSEQQIGSIHKISTTELEGSAVMAPTSRRPKPYTVYFVAVFDKPFEKFSAWKDGKLVAVQDKIEGEKTGAYVSFATKKGRYAK